LPDEPLRKKVPELTLDRTVRLLEGAPGEPALRLPRETALVDYHARRNEVSRKLHAKTWRARHGASDSCVMSMTTTRSVEPVSVSLPGGIMCGIGWPA